MYEYIKGTLTEKEPQKAVIERNGLGYRLLIPLSTYTDLPVLGSQVQLFLTHIVREDSETLYAFLTKAERSLFEVIINVSGIGPKTGLAIIGHIEISAFQRAIASADVRLLSKVPGIGKKTAERLVVEMRDKMKGISKKGAFTAVSGDDSLLSDAINALINLGYPLSDAQRAVQEAMQEKKSEKDLGRLITASLKKI